MKSITVIVLVLIAVSWCHADDDGQYNPHLYGDVRYSYSSDPYYRRFYDNGKYGSIYKAYQPRYYQAPSREILSPLQVKFGDSVDQAPFPTVLTYRKPAVPVVSTYRPFVYTTPKPFVVTKSPSAAVSTYRQFVYTTPKPFAVPKSPSAVYYKSVSDGAASILRDDRTYDENNYHYAYETNNGIAAEESGIVDTSSNGIGGGTKVSGFYEYIGDDGLKYRVDYIADENGYRASGAHLPKAP